MWQTSVNSSTCTSLQILHNIQLFLRVIAYVYSAHSNICWFAFFPTSSFQDRIKTLLFTLISMQCLILSFSFCSVLLKSFKQNQIFFPRFVNFEQQEAQFFWQLHRHIKINASDLMYFPCAMMRNEIKIIKKVLKSHMCNKR